jgi:hypothetical protein
MRLRSHRRNLVVWRQSVGSAGRHGTPRLFRLARTSRTRRWIRAGTLLSVVGLIHLARVVRPRWRPLLAGGVLTAVGFLLRGGAGGMVLLPGLMLLVSVPLIPARTKADRRRHAELERELAGYSTPAQRRDLEATLDRYPDGITREIRDILARQALATSNHRIPGTGVLGPAGECANRP